MLHSKEFGLNIFQREGVGDINLTATFLFQRRLTALKGKCPREMMVSLSPRLLEISTAGASLIDGDEDLPQEPCSK